MSNDQTIRLGGRYRLDRRIAVGGMGEVWSATDEVLHRVVAAKTLQANLMDEPGFLERFRAEARHAASLSHPGIATVYDYGEANQHAYLVMEMVDGRTLSRLLADEAPLDPERAASILAQTCEALAAAHRAGVVHRDIKPGNIMLTADDRVKITDFGISKLVGSVPLTTTGQILGTPQYISPEQATGSSATPASDIYSLGVIGYEMLSGHRPFQADTPVGFAMAHVHQPAPPLLATVPRDLANLISEMMVKDATVRPADAAVLANRFSQRDGHVSPPIPPGRARERNQEPTVVHTSVQPPMATHSPSPSFDPPTAVAPLPATIVSTRGDAAPHRTVPALIAFVIVSVIVIATLVIATRDGGSDQTLTSLGDDPALTSPVTVGSAAPVEAPTTVPATAPQTAPPTTAIATTVPPFDPATVVGLDHDEARRQLEALGYDVREERVKQGGGEKNSVIDVRIEPLAGTPGRVVLAISDGKGNEDDDD